MSSSSIKLRVDVEPHLADIDKQIDKYEKNLSELQKQADAMGFGDNIKKEIEDAMKKLKELRDEYASEVRKMANEKLDTSSFDDFSKDIETKMEQVSQDIINAEEKIQNLQNTVNDLDLDKITEEVNNMRSAFRKFKDDTKLAVKMLRKFSLMTDQQTQAQKSLKGVAEQLNALNQIDLFDSTGVDKKKLKDIDGLNEELANAYKNYIRLRKVVTDKSGSYAPSQISDAEKQLSALMPLLSEYIKKVAIANGYDLSKLFKTDFKFTDSKGTLFNLDEITRLFDKDLPIIKKRLGNKAKKLNEEINDTVFTNANTFTFNDGGVKIPVVLDEKMMDKIESQLKEFINTLSSQSEKNPVDVTLRLFPLKTDKEEAKAVNQHIKDIRAQIPKFEDKDLSESVEKLMNDFEKEYRRALMLKIKVELTDDAEGVAHKVEQIKQAVKKADISVSPRIEVSEKEAEEFADKLDKVKGDFTVDFTQRMQNMADSLNRLLSEGKVKNWSKAFEDGLEAISAKLQNMKDLLLPLSELYSTMSAKKNGQGRPSNEFLAAKGSIDKFSETMDALHKSLLDRENAPSLNPAKFTQQIQEAIDEAGIPVQVPVEPNTEGFATALEEELGVVPINIKVNGITGVGTGNGGGNIVINAGKDMVVNADNTTVTSTGKKNSTGEKNINTEESEQKKTYKQKLTDAVGEDYINKTLSDVFFGGYKGTPYPKEEKLARDEFQRSYNSYVAAKKRIKDNSEVLEDAKLEADRIKNNQKDEQKLEFLRNKIPLLGKVEKRNGKQYNSLLNQYLKENGINKTPEDKIPNKEKKAISEFSNIYKGYMSLYGQVESLKNRTPNMGNMKRDDKNYKREYNKKQKEIDEKLAEKNAELQTYIEQNPILEGVSGLLSLGERDKLKRKYLQDKGIEYSGKISEDVFFSRLSDEVVAKGDFPLTASSKNGIDAETAKQNRADMEDIVNRLIAYKAKGGGKSIDELTENTKARAKLKKKFREKVGLDEEIQDYEEEIPEVYVRKKKTRKSDYDGISDADLRKRISELTAEKKKISDKTVDDLVGNSLSDWTEVGKITNEISRIKRATKQAEELEAKGLIEAPEEDLSEKKLKKLGFDVDEYGYAIDAKSRRELTERIKQGLVGSYGGDKQLLEDVSKYTDQTGKEFLASKRRREQIAPLDKEINKLTTELDLRKKEVEAEERAKQEAQQAAQEAAQKKNAKRKKKQTSQPTFEKKIGETKKETKEVEAQNKEIEKNKQLKQETKKVEESKGESKTETETKNIQKQNKEIEKTVQEKKKVTDLEKTFDNWKEQIAQKGGFDRRKVSDRENLEHISGQYALYKQGGGKRDITELSDDVKVQKALKEAYDKYTSSIKEQSVAQKEESASVDSLIQKHKELTEISKDAATRLQQGDQSASAELINASKEIYEIRGQLQKQGFNWDEQSQSFKQMTQEAIGAENAFEKLRTIVSSQGSLPQNTKAGKQNLRVAVSQYQKYLEAGGTRPITDLTDDISAQEKLKAAYEATTTAIQKQTETKKADTKSAVEQKEVENIQKVTKAEEERQAVQEKENHFQGLIDRINKYGEEKVKIDELRDIYKEYLELVNQYGMTDTNGDHISPIQNFLIDQLDKNGYKFDERKNDAFKTSKNGSWAMTPAYRKGFGLKQNPELAEVIGANWAMKDLEKPDKDNVQVIEEEASARRENAEAAEKEASAVRESNESKSKVKKYNQSKKYLKELENAPDINSSSKEGDRLYNSELVNIIEKHSVGSGNGSQLTSLLFDYIQKGLLSSLSQIEKFLSSDSIQGIPDEFIQSSKKWLEAEKEYRRNHPDLDFFTDDIDIIIKHIQESISHNKSYLDSIINQISDDEKRNPNETTVHGSGQWGYYYSRLYEANGERQTTVGERLAVSKKEKENIEARIKEDEARLANYLNQKQSPSSELQSTSQFAGKTQEELEQCLATEEKWLSRCTEGSKAYEKRKANIAEINALLGKSVDEEKKTETTTPNNLQKELKETEQQAQKASTAIKEIRVWLKDENTDAIINELVPSKYANLVNGKVFQNRNDMQNTMMALSRGSKFALEHGLAAPNDLTDAIKKIEALEDYNQLLEKKNQLEKQSNETPVSSQETDSELSLTERQIEALDKEAEAIINNINAKGKDKISTEELIESYEKLMAIDNALIKLESKLGYEPDYSGQEVLGNLNEYINTQRGVIQATASGDKGKPYWYELQLEGDDTKFSPTPVGEKFGQDYIEGILSTVSGTREAASQLPENAKDATAEAQQSKSPSRVAEALGEYWGEGYAKGIRKHKGEVEDAVRELVQAGILTTEDLQTDLDILRSGGFGRYYKDLEDPLSNIIISEKAKIQTKNIAQTGQKVAQHNARIHSTNSEALNSILKTGLKLPHGAFMDTAGWLSSYIDSAKNGKGLQLHTGQGDKDTVAVLMDFDEEINNLFERGGKILERIPVELINGYIDEFTGEFVENPLFDPNFDLTSYVKKKYQEHLDNKTQTSLQRPIGQTGGEREIERYLAKHKQKTSRSTIAKRLSEYWGESYSKGAKAFNESEIEESIRNIVSLGGLTIDDLRSELDTLKSGGFGKNYKALLNPLESIVADYDKQQTEIENGLTKVINKLNNSKDMSAKKLDKADETYSKWIKKAEDLGMDITKFQSDYSSARSKFNEFADESLGKVDEEIKVDINTLEGKNKLLASEIEKITELGKKYLGEEDVDVLQQTRVKETKQGSDLLRSYKVVGKTGSVTYAPNGRVIATKQTHQDDYTRRQQTVNKLVKEQDSLLNSILSKEKAIGLARADGHDILADTLAKQVEEKRVLYDENSNALKELGEEEILQQQLIKETERRKQQEEELNILIAKRLEKSKEAEEKQRTSDEKKAQKEQAKINQEVAKRVAEVEKNNLTLDDQDIAKITNVRAGITKPKDYYDYKESTEGDKWIGALATADTNIDFDYVIGKYEELLEAEKEVSKYEKESQKDAEAYKDLLDEAVTNRSALRGEIFGNESSSGLLDKLPLDRFPEADVNKLAEITKKIDEVSASDQASKTLLKQKKAADMSKEAYEELGAKVKEYIKLRKLIAQGKGLDSDVEKVDKLKNEIEELNSELENTPQLFNERLQKKAMAGMDTIEEDVERIQTGISQKEREKIVKRYQRVQSQINKQGLDIDFEKEHGKHTEDFINRLSDIQNKIAEINEKPLDSIKESDIQDAQALLNELILIRKEGKLTSNKTANENSVQKGLAQINSILSSNTKRLFKKTDVYRELVSLQSAFKNFDTSRPQSELAELTTELLRTKAKFEDLDNTVKGKNLFQTFIERLHGTTAQLIAQYLSWMDIIRYLRSMATTLIDLDTQLVDLRKTTSMTTNELNEFYNQSSEVAKELGVTTSEIISQAAAWSRLGYSTKEASTEMAKLSSQFTSISPGMDTDSATDYLVSTMKAYGIEVDEVERKIMDNVNRIGNTFATTNSEIGEMLTRSSAAMNAANNSIEETIALESAAVEVTRNAEMTGTAFRTVSMRIRGLDEETEEELENYEELKGKIADLTKTKDTPGGVSLFTDASKTEYKSTYQFLKDISKIYDQISDKDQATLLETIGGKRGAQSLAAILADFSEVERAMDEMEGAAGSADAEMGIIKDSLEYKLNALKQTWVGTLQEITDRGDIGGVIDFLTSVSEGLGGIVSSLGLVKTAIIGIGTVIGSQKLG